MKPVKRILGWTIIAGVFSMLIAITCISCGVLAGLAIWGISFGLTALIALGVNFAMSDD